MRIDIQSYSMNKIASTKSTESQALKTINTEEQKISSQASRQGVSKEKLQQAIDSINEIYKINHSELKFVFHEGLEEYFVQLVNSETDEVVKEIPSKKLLDVFYEMQKLIGIKVDEKI